MLNSEFKLPKGMHGRFAIVKLWPEIKAAEDENIARFKNTAARLGLKCVEITPEGEIIGGGGVKVHRGNCDFVIHLHFETPKIYDVFSFVALWNPIKFYHDWGYDRFSRNLLTHDDFISCDSPAADDHVIRLIHNDPFHLPPKFKIHHSLSEPIHKPKTGSLQLFYAGINWERLGKGRSRHQELLNRLDTTGRMRIYGPKLFQGVDVWQGYNSYQHEIPFDGVSMINEIARCGAALVLSSEAHKQSALMSNRLFEGLAAGALIICDENPFARRHFGDTLLYIDCRESVDVQYENIIRHLDWAAANPDAACELAESAQAIFIKNFKLDLRLSELYTGFARRQKELLAHRDLEGAAQPKIRVFVLQDVFNQKKIAATIEELNQQIYRNFNVSFVIDATHRNQWEDFLNDELLKCNFPYGVIEQEITIPAINGNQSKRRLGEILCKTLEALDDELAFIYIAPNESIMSNHLDVLAAAFCSAPMKSVHAASCLLKHTPDGKKYFYDYSSEINLNSYIPNKPNGLSRFLISRTNLEKDICHLLPALDSLAIVAFFGDELLVQSISLATCVINIQHEYPKNDFTLEEERAALRDYFSSMKIISDRLFGLNKNPDSAENNQPCAEVKTLNRDEQLVTSLYRSILDRDPSKKDLEFYLPRVERLGRKRLLRDILLSPEAVKTNSIRVPLIWAIRNLWRNPNGQN